METQQQINSLHTRQLELRAIMARSDDYAAECVKEGVVFKQERPKEFAEYTCAKVEFNQNELSIEALEREIEQQIRERLPETI